MSVRKVNGLMGLLRTRQERLGDHETQEAHHLRTVLVGAARSAARTKGSYLKDKFPRLKARHGVKRAEVALAHKILTVAYHMMSRGVGCELGGAYLDQVDQTRTAANLKRRLERLGYVVTIQPNQPVPNPVGGGRIVQATGALFLVAAA